MKRGGRQKRIPFQRKMLQDSRPFESAVSSVPPLTVLIICFSAPLSSKESRLLGMKCFQLMPCGAYGFCALLFSTPLRVLWAGSGKHTISPLVYFPCALNSVSDLKMSERSVCIHTFICICSFIFVCLYCIIYCLFILQHLCLFILHHLLALPLPWVASNDKINTHRPGKPHPDQKYI